MFIVASSPTTLMTTVRARERLHNSPVLTVNSLSATTAKSVLKKRPQIPLAQGCSVNQPQSQPLLRRHQLARWLAPRPASHPTPTLLLHAKNSLSHITKCAFIARQRLRSRAVVTQFPFNLVHWPFFLRHHRSSCTEYHRIWPVRTSLTKRG